jgi:hypothetical protein
MYCELEDPASWNSIGIEYDPADSIDTIQDQFKEIIDSHWIGGRPTEGARNVVLQMVNACVDLLPKERLEPTEILIRFLNFLEGKKQSPALIIDCLKIVFQLEPLSQTQVARRHGVTRATVSKICVNFTEEFAVAPSRGMKSQRARVKYSETQKNTVRKGKAPAKVREELKAGFKILQ